MHDVLKLLMYICYHSDHVLFNNNSVAISVMYVLLDTGVMIFYELLNMFDAYMCPRSLKK